MTYNLPTIVRECAIIDRAQYQVLGEEGVARLMDEVQVSAFAKAAQIGITDPVVRARHWDLHVVCGFADYPMYLLGPNAPQIRSAQDVFDHVWHLDNPLAKYEVVVESQAVMNSYGV